MMKLRNLLSVDDYCIGMMMICNCTSLTVTMAIVILNRCELLKENQDCPEIACLVF